MSQFMSPSPSPHLLAHKSVFYVCISIAALQVHQYHLSGFHTCVLVCDICLSLSELFHLYSTLWVHPPHRTESNAFLFMVEYYFIMYRYHNFFIHSSVDGHLGSFHFLAILNCTHSLSFIWQVWESSLNILPKTRLYALSNMIIIPSTLCWP